jgi:hypothetical protein
MGAAFLAGVQGGDSQAISIKRRGAETIRRGKVGAGTVYAVGLPKQVV